MDAPQSRGVAYEEMTSSAVIYSPTQKWSIAAGAAGEHMLSVKCGLIPPKVVPGTHKSANPKLAPHCVNV